MITWKRILYVARNSNLSVTFNLNPCMWSLHAFAHPSYEDYLDAGASLGPVRVSLYVSRPYRPNYN